jgi:hypothetical protein
VRPDYDPEDFAPSDYDGEVMLFGWASLNPQRKMRWSTESSTEDAMIAKLLVSIYYMM